MAIDNEEWAYNNCLENTAANGCVGISCVLGNETYRFTEQYDVILANINRNVIMQNIEKWKGLMKPGAVMLVSGILQSDEMIILNEAQRIGLAKNAIKRNNGWLAISFSAL